MARAGVIGFGPVDGIPGYKRGSGGRLRRPDGKSLSRAEAQVVQDSGWLIPIGDILKDLDGETVEVGFFSEDVAKRALINEFGAPTNNIPPRPFMRTAFDSNVQSYQDEARQRIGISLDDKAPAATALVPVANKMRNDLIRSINEWSDPPNKESTIESKGVNNPLVDTGEMQRSVEIKIRANATLPTTLTEGAQ